eukprot:XP_011444328.2 PREDICTED: uncharacterized protein LOC105340129 [Crassostrea gigas]
MKKRRSSHILYFYLLFFSKGLDHENSLLIFACLWENDTKTAITEDYLNPYIRYIMQMVKVVLVTVLLTLCVIVDCLPHSSTKMRQKRGFRQSIVDRMGHGFGKRANTDLYDPYLTKTPNLMTADELTTNILNSEDLAQAIVKKFIDLDGDGIISTAELLRTTS